MSLPITETLWLPIILAWIRVNLRKIVLGGVVFALLAIPIALLRPKTYDSAATLLVFPPTFKDRSPSSIAEMMPAALPVEAYKAVALSPSLLAEVIQRVPLEKTGIQVLQDRLEVELVQMGSRTTQGSIIYAQALMFHAKANSPELAARTAETWAEVFKEYVDSVATKGVGDTFLLLDALHNNAKTELEQADLALAEHQKAWNLDLVKAQLEAKQKGYTEFEGTLKQTEVALASEEMKLKALEDEFAKEPEKKTYFRAPSDDAYWIAGLQNDGKPKIEPEKGLRTEEPNPNYVQIRTLVVTAKEDIDGLKAKKETILLKLDELKNEIKALTDTFVDKTVERYKLTRESDSLKASYVMVRAEFEKGRMADRTRASDIVIAGKAVAPDEPSGLGNAMIVIAAAFIGMLVTGTFMALKEISEMGPFTGAGTGGLGALMARAPDPAPDGPPAQPGGPVGE